MSLIICKLKLDVTDRQADKDEDGLGIYLIQVDNEGS